MRTQVALALGSAGEEGGRARVRAELAGMHAAVEGTRAVVVVVGSLVDVEEGTRAAEAGIAVEGIAAAGRLQAAVEEGMRLVAVAGTLLADRAVAVLNMPQAVQVAARGSLAVRLARRLLAAGCASCGVALRL